MSVTTLCEVEAALSAVAEGKFVVVLDDVDRENEADLILAADHVTPEALAFMVRHTSGLVCVGMTGERLDDLGLPLMVPKNSEGFGTAFTVSVDFRPETTTSSCPPSFRIALLPDTICKHSPNPPRING